MDLSNEEFMKALDYAAMDGNVGGQVIEALEMYIDEFLKRGELR